MIIKILGPVCKNCDTMKENTETALKEMNIEAEIIRVINFKDIMAYGIISTPALVIDEKLASYGRALKTKEIVRILGSLK